MSTIVEWPREKNNPGRQPPLAHRHQLARGVIDRRDVIGIEAVPQPPGRRPRSPYSSGRADTSAEGTPLIVVSRCVNSRTATWSATSSVSPTVTVAPRSAVIRGRGQPWPRDRSGLELLVGRSQLQARELDRNGPSLGRDHRDLVSCFAQSGVAARRSRPARGRRLPSPHCSAPCSSVACG
jgi:hypothetical protein